jgi:hypothetical protein
MRDGNHRERAAAAVEMAVGVTRLRHFNESNGCAWPA